VLWSDLHADALVSIEEAVRHAFRTQTGPAVAWWKIVTRSAKVRGHRQPAACVQVGCILATHVECCRSLSLLCCCTRAVPALLVALLEQSQLY
jgi:hypothetical protein